MTENNGMSRKIIIKQCHICNHVIETLNEPQRCPKCQKSYLPLNYFHKIHSHEPQIEELFSSSDELLEEELIKGLYVLW